MTRIYTRTGDDGSTGLFGGRRVRKDDLRVLAYGEVDELCSALGVASAALAGERQRAGVGELVELVARLQADLFVLGAELATPADAPARAKIPTLTAEHTQRLEREIDQLQSGLPPLSTFILPGGSAPGAALHLARAVCRRAERAMVHLAREEPIPAEALAWINRLADLLFVAARAANHRLGQAETAWLP